MRQATVSSRAVMRTVPPAGVCSTQFLSTLVSASRVQAASPMNEQPGSTRAWKVTPARSAATASGSCAALTSADASTQWRSRRTTPASRRASLSSDETSHCSCSSMRPQSRTRWESSGVAAALRMSSSSMPSDVSGVLSWWEMSARASASACFSASSSSLATTRRVTVLSSWLARMASSPSPMPLKLTLRSPESARSRRSESWAMRR